MIGTEAEWEADLLDLIYGEPHAYGPILDCKRILPRTGLLERPKKVCLSQIRQNSVHMCYIHTVIYILIQVDIGYRAIQPRANKLIPGRKPAGCLLDRRRGAAKPPLAGLHCYMAGPRGLVSWFFVRVWDKLQSSVQEGSC